MKRIKSYKLFESKESVEDICQKYRIRNWTNNEDGTVDVDGDVNLNSKKLDELPLKFGRVNGYFHCQHNNLTSLEGCPNWVGGGFNCSHNKLTSLVGGPTWVGGYFDCSDNKLTNLEGCPERIFGTLYCESNNLTNLVGSPNWVGGNFLCSNNKLTNLEGCPEKIFGYLDCERNKIHSLDFYPTILTGRLETHDNPIHEIWENVRDNHGHYLHLFDLHGPIRFEGGEWVCYREFLDNFFDEIGVPSTPKLKKYREV